jgi:hypothetical protein
MRYSFDLKNKNFSWNSAMKFLNKNGFINLRNAFEKKDIDKISLECEQVLKKPSILGSYGYYKKDLPKKLFDPMLLGGNVVDCFVNKKVLSFVKKYLGGDFTLAECNLKYDAGMNLKYFPFHKDFSIGWNLRLHKDDNVKFTKKDIASPIGVGGMIYLHDTKEGAFCYCAGSHNFKICRGEPLSRYPMEEQKEILEKTVKIHGLKGDLILFDDRGFHGPEQPSRKDRTVLIFDYYKLSKFGQRGKMKIPVFLNDLGHLDLKQLKVLGLGYDTMISHKNYHTRSFDRTKKYKFLKKIVEIAYHFDFLKIKFMIIPRFIKNKLFLMLTK